MDQATMRYTKTARILHWLIALAIFGMFALGWFMTELPKEAPKQMAYDLFEWGIYTWQLSEEASPRTFYYNLHKSLGITLLALIAIRILWRLTHKPPPILDSHQPWEKKLAKASHYLLYLLMVALPLSGIVMSTYSKYGIKWFGVPFIKGLDNNAMREFYVEIHEAIGIAILLLIVLHITGALKHKFIDKDKTLERML